MYTSLVLLALSACPAHTAATIPVASTWRSDYSLALKEGQRTKRPLAIFVASGSEGWDKVSKDGGLDKEAKELLLSRYVCVYVDAGTESGRRLADEFEMPNRRGVVISDSTGQKQAFWHAGSLSNDDLDHYLRKYADPEQVVRKTETVSRGQPTAAPTYYSPPAYYPPMMQSIRGCST
jgi:hypothetical protein